MDDRADSETVFSPRRWFIGDDGLVRPIWRCFLFIALGFALYVLVAQALYGLPGVWPREIRMTIRLLAMVGGLLALSWLLLTVFDRRRFTSLGLWFYSGAGREFALGSLIGGVLIGAVVLAMVVARAVTYHAYAPQELNGVLLWAAILLVASAGEEIAFRGYGMQRLIQAVGEPAGVLGFSALFALVHLSNPGSTTLSAINTFLAGILLSMTYLKTRALWLPIGLHWAWNFLMGQVFSLPLSGLNFAPRLFKAELSGPEWISGGSYGPEGSILLTVVCILAILWLGQTRSISPSPAVEEGLE